MHDREHTSWLVVIWSIAANQSTREGTVSFPRRQDMSRGYSTSFSPAEKAESSNLEAPIALRSKNGRMSVADFT